jgi:hypothetical protein
MDPIVRQIVGRCHVRETYRWVIRYVISRMANGYQTFRSLPRKRRKDLLRSIVKCHRDNRKLYTRVMRGGF